MDDMQGLVNDFLSKKRSRREFVNKAMALGVSAAGIEAILSSCGGGSGGSGSGVYNLKWSVWGNPGELQRFYQFTDQFNTQHPNIKAQLQPIPSSNDYEPKLLTQINGRVAPDVFYVGDATMIKLIQNKSIANLTPLLDSSASQEKASDYIEGLWGVAKTPDGSIYGVVVDCNPLILWVNKGVLQQAGITQSPMDLYEQGKWNRDAFTSMIQQLNAKGKYGFIIDHWTLPIWSWITVSGGQVYADNGRGEFVVNQDPKSLDTMKWLAENIRAKTMVYASSLPKGQGSDLAFMTNQIGFVCAGRWYLPEFKKVDGLQYDIVPFPTNTGKKLEPAGVAIAYMSLNNASKNRDAGFQFLTNFVSAKGQTFRLQNGGNALPSIRGADQVVTENNLPPHASYFIDARNIGYAPFTAEDATPGLSNDILDKLDPMWLQGADVKKTLDAVAAMANPRIKQAMAGQ